jgi:hypothetical protein
MMLLTCLLGLVASTVFNRLEFQRPLRKDCTPAPKAPASSWWICDRDEFHQRQLEQQPRMSGTRNVFDTHRPNLQLAGDPRTIPTSFPDGELTDE